MNDAPKNEGGRPTPAATAYALLRSIVGLNFILHGLVRFPKLAGFRGWMVKMFEDSWLPSVLVSAWATVLPFIEFGIGALLLVGLFTYRAAVAGAVVIGLLMSGACLLEKWDLVALQMIYVALFAALVAFVSRDTFSLDAFRQKSERQ